MISKETFIKAINFIEEQEKKENKLCEVLEDLAGDYYRCEAFVYNQYQDMLLNVLQEDLNDTTDLIGYYLFEYRDMSEEKKKEQLKETPELESLETIFDYLVKEKENENRE